MKDFDNINVKSAVKSHSQMSLKQFHLTTTEIGQINCLYHRPLLLGDQFDVPMRAFCRLAPLVKPTYGEFKFRNAGFFVPYHQVAFDAEAFMQGKKIYEGYVPKLRTITYREYCLFLRDYCVSFVGNPDAGLPPEDGVFDWTFVNTSGTRLYAVFSTVGRYYLRILNQLGYAIPQNVNLQTGSSWSITFSDKTLNAVPLLCFFKAFNDYMAQSTRFNSSRLTFLLKQIQIDKAVTGYYNNSNGQLTSSCLFDMFSSLRLAYDNDYFVSAWQKPENPINSIEDILSFNAESGNGDIIENGVDNIYLSQGTNSVVNQRSLMLLRSFYNFVRRHNYAGSKDVQQVFAQWGIKPEDYQVKYAHILGTFEEQIQVGDVTSTASTPTGDLGDYAGKGIMGCDSHYSYKSNDYGMLFIFGWITVNPMYPYGFEREVLKSDPLDFFTPEFDGVGVDAISFGEIFANPIADLDDSTLDNLVFGFTEKYNDYRFARDQITGDFRSYRNGSDMNVWHFGRLLNSLRKSGNMVAQSSAMNTLSPTDSEYNRIFSITSGIRDHFYISCLFDVHAVRPMLSINQATGLPEGNLSVPRNGNTLS